MSRKNVSDIEDEVECHFIPLKNRSCERCGDREPVLLVVYGDEGHQFVCDDCLHDDEKYALQRSVQLLRDTYDS